MFNAQVPAAYVTTGLINVLCSFILLDLERSALLRSWLLA
jgi:hypothetical protein